MESKAQTCGGWTLLREIGRGAYGRVYLATDSSGARAAVKVCRRDALDSGSYEREKRGAKLYSAIPPGEGLVRMRAVAEEDWGFYAVMDLADDDFGGGNAASYVPKTLARVMEGSKALSLEECVRLGAVLCAGLADLQRRMLLHRDIKPGNVLYVGGRPVLSDPGLVVEESEASSLVGTPGYVPPERFTSAGSDVYSLGLTLKAASFGRRLEDLDKGPAVEADSANPHFPAWWRILNKATDPTPERRYRSAKAMLKDLSALERRMKISSAVRSRAAKVIGAAAIAVLASLCIFLPARRPESRSAIQQKEIDALNAYRNAEEKHKERMIRDAMWDVFSMDIASGVDNMADDIFLAAAHDQARVRNLVDRRRELDERRKSLRGEIKALRAEAKRKLASGMDDAEEYAKAEALHKECVATGKEISAIGKDLSPGGKKRP